MPPVAEVSRFLGVLAFVAGAGSVIVLLLRDHPVIAALRARATWAAAAVASTATAGSLWYRLAVASCCSPRSPSSSPSGGRGR